MPGDKVPFPSPFPGTPLPPPTWQLLRPPFLFLLKTVSPGRDSHLPEVLGLEVRRTATPGGLGGLSHGKAGVLRLQAGEAGLGSGLASPQEREGLAGVFVVTDGPLSPEGCPGAWSGRCSE